MKKILLTMIIMLLAIPCVCANPVADVYIDGVKLESEAYIINDRIFVPLRAVSENMGAEVSWDPETRSAYINQNSDENITKVIEDVGESVVAIVGNYNPKYMSQQALSYNQSYAHGTGVVIKSNGTILTNAHVVENLENLTVIMQNGDSFSGEVLYSDTTSDLAVVKISKLGLKPVTFGKKEDIVVGKTVIAIGTPLSLNMKNSASKGIISGTQVNIGEYYYFTQSDVAINGGNSGGPLVNTKGELIGINSIKISGTGIEGMSFSIPVDTVEYILNQFEKNKQVLRPDAGLTFSESWEAKLGVPTKKGITVVSSNTPEILKDDVVTHVNGIEVHSITQYNEILKETYSGESITFSFTRNGETKTAAIKVVLK